MHFSLTKAAASAAFLPVASVISDKPITPILGHVAIQAYPDGTIMFRGMDGTITATSSADGEVKSPGAITVSSDTLADVVRGALPDATLTFKLSEDAKRLEVRTGRSLFRLATLPIGEYPEFATHEFRGALVATGAMVGYMIEAVRFAILTGKAAMTAQLGGMMLCVHGDEFHAVATSGFQYSRLRMSRPEGWPDDLAVKVHPEMLDRIAAVASLARQDNVELVATDSRIQITAGRLCVSGSVLNKDYPNYIAMAEKFTAAANVNVVVPRGELVDALRRILSVGNVWAKSDKGVKFEFGPDHLTISARSQVGDAMERIEIEGGADMTLGFNPDFLFPPLVQIEGDTVTFGVELKDSGKTGAAVILSGKNPDLLMFVGQRAV
jgi:DNA polymerase-3 subunit beta